MRTHRFGRKLKLPSTMAIKHQIRRLMFADLVKAEMAEATKESPLQPRERLVCSRPDEELASERVAHDGQLSRLGPVSATAP
jgi:hypothetical protein